MHWWRTARIRRRGTVVMHMGEFVGPKMTAADREKAIEAIWEQVPDPHCKGLCTNACTVIPMTMIEARRLRRAGHPLPHHADVLVKMVASGERQDCPALVDGQCTVYEMRPLICRLYGAVEDMQCEHGCRPDGGLLPTGTARRLIDLAEMIGGER